MLDLLFDFLSDILEGAGDVIGDLVSSIDIGEVISTAALVAGVITVASLTETAIRNELNRRQELKGKGVTSAVITDFIKQNGYTEITLAALNNKNEQVGIVKMRGNKTSGIKKGDKIKL